MHKSFLLPHVYFMFFVIIEYHVFFIIVEKEYPLNGKIMQELHQNLRSGRFILFPKVKHKRNKRNNF